MKTPQTTPVPTSFQEIPVDGLYAVERFCPTIKLVVEQEDINFRQSHPRLRDDLEAFKEHAVRRHSRQLSGLLQLPSWSLEFWDNWEKTLLMETEVWLRHAAGDYEGFAHVWKTCRRCRESVDAGLKNGPIPYGEDSSHVRAIMWDLGVESWKLIVTARIAVGHSASRPIVRPQLVRVLREALDRWKPLRFDGFASYSGETDQWSWVTDDTRESSQIARLLVRVLGMSGRPPGQEDWIWLDWLREEELRGGGDGYRFDYKRGTNSMCSFEDGQLRAIEKSSIRQVRLLLDEATALDLAPSAPSRDGERAGNEEISATLSPAFCNLDGLSDWPDIEFSFTSEERVNILVKGKIRQPANYGDLGFADRRNGRPAKAWDALKALAESNGVLTNGSAIQTDWPAVEKRAQEIRVRLRRLFKLDTDPLPYVEGGYRATFKISAARSYQS
jgi:hypothetical protein